MTRFQSFFALATAAFLAAPLLASGNPPYSTGSEIHSNQPFFRVGGDRVVFGYQLAPSCGDKVLEQTALAMKTRTRSDRWDDQWYAFNVQPGRCLVMAWYNLDGRRFGWAAILNKPNSWGVKSNSDRWEDIGNGVQKKYSYKINGQGVDLDILNPENTGALNGDDILISFGF